MHHFRVPGRRAVLRGRAAGEDRRARSARRSTSTATRRSSGTTGCSTTRSTGSKHLVCYSVKANSNLACSRALVALGAGVDIVSSGELFRALKAGGDPKKIVFSGVGKREDEIEYALEAGILALQRRVARASCDAHRARRARAWASARRSRCASTPTSTPQTHPYISTGPQEEQVRHPGGRGARRVPRAPRSCRTSRSSASTATSARS